MIMCIPRKISLHAVLVARNVKIYDTKNPDTTYNLLLSQLCYDREEGSIFKHFQTLKMLLKV